MSEKTNPIPIIDVAPLFEGPSAARDAVDQEIGQACETMSSFMAVGLPHELKPDTTKMKKFFTLFDQPDEIKVHMGNRRVNPNSDRGYRGFARSSENPDGQQYFDMGPEPPVDAPPIEGIKAAIEPNVWPPEEAMPGWTEGMINYFKVMEEFSILIIGSIARYLHVSEQAATKRYEESNSTLRLLYYPDQETDRFQDDNGVTRPEIARKHTDNDGLALIWEEAKGLQLQTPAGDWNYIPVVPEAFSVHLGDALETQTSGRMLATPHRVLGQGVKRRSIVFFLEPGLFGSIRPFSMEDVEAGTPLEDTYAASILHTLRRSGRA